MEIGAGLRARPVFTMHLPYANVTLRHYNPGAQDPLILPVHVICNTDDEQLYENVRVNSRARGNWQRLEPAHEGVAILCGSGPSLADTLDEIRAHQAAGARIFAMNGAARFLWDHAIHADYQVILDARLETANLVGPAKAHLFASQVHPETFRRAPASRLWHLQVGEIDKLLPPDYQRSYCLIGGAASVGNTATCLVYAMGYREMHCYGYDSSHRGDAGHAFHQKMNDGDPCAVVTFGGREYTCSLTMKLQAEKFIETSRALRQMGVQIEVHGSGLLPDMYRAPVETLTEQQKYERVWSYPEYRIEAPGEDLVETFLDVAKPAGRVIDFGCGTGRAGVKLAEAGLDVLLVDFTDNCRDLAAIPLPFLQHDLTQHLDERAGFGYCTDVLEHIPPKDVEVVISNCLQACNSVFFQISTVPDNMGVLVGHDLHLSVHPHAWWRDIFTGLGYLVQWEEERLGTALFFITNRKVN